MPRTRNISVAAILLAVVGMGASAPKPATKPLVQPPIAVDALAAPSEPKIEWRASYSEALAEAHATSRPLVVNFTAEWCGVCRTMESEAFSDPDIIELMNQAVSVKVDIDREGAVAYAYRVMSIPRTFLVNKHDEVVSDMLGYRDVKTIRKAVVEFLAGADKETGFSKIPVVTSAGASPEAVAAEAEAAIEIDPDDDDALLELLGHKSSRVRERVIEAIVGKGDGAMPILIRGLQSDYLGTRIAAWTAILRLNVSEKGAYDPWAPKAERARLAKGVVEASTPSPAQ
jgi:thiol-disulfide isomerase/thioredoxin